MTMHKSEITHTHAQENTDSHTNTLTYTQVHARTHTYTHIHTHGHTCTHTYTHTPTHAHIPHQKLLGDKFSTPMPLFCLTCTIISNKKGILD
mmetsp:Transcript_14989/g.23877  ORF Transcript_14989/g.23877 Transcript_14989/m.23877 type:complete len:92 (+) Transcript_14989:989-1264(+)